jgi:hypothetical protein
MGWWGTFQVAGTSAEAARTALQLASAANPFALPIGPSGHLKKGPIPVDVKAVEVTIPEGGHEPRSWQRPHGQQSIGQRARN